MQKASNRLMPNQMLYNTIIQDYIYFLNSAIVPITYYLFLFVQPIINYPILIFNVIAE